MVARVRGRWNAADAGNRNLRAPRCPVSNAGVQNVAPLVEFCHKALPARDRLHLTGVGELNVTKISVRLGLLFGVCLRGRRS
ncbi:hypothetical protein, partial [Mesorhizobium sp.]|uniref:hypothetical protein n=1 Tax=Mesorhizobium sp. TaxID=1871066 RepID=UPI0025C6418F